ncbi:hypothetical protein EXE30_06760 [Acinetobacter halotolerans]|uniref:Uncharacterized protein n=1 Tax=Acinetobacter halotolerans TaxID=1752076 RepID=A0A4Q6XCF7_9GAMM|nr:hypothetical protein [Acinetobacter halotolerans]RZF53670.1 hypothetical protein EXE30_06760 [Acinetobacter halotolerans]
MKDLRFNMKIEALTTAAVMIDEISAGGLTNEHLGLSEEEFQVFLSECSKLGKSLNKQAIRLLKKRRDNQEQSQ